jgi:UDP-glucose 4-epimerase
MSSPFEGAESFNVRGSVVPMNEFVGTLLEVTGVDRVTFGNHQLPIAPDLDDARLEARFGPLPRTSLKDGVAETYRRFAKLQAAGKLDLSELDA